MPRFTKIIIRKFLHPITFLLIVSTTLIINYNFTTIIRNIYYKTVVANSYEYPGSYLNFKKSFNESFCNFQFGLTDELKYADSDLDYSPELGIESPYRVLYNVIKGDPNGAAAVTYATHITADFVNYIAEIVRFWEGPVSVAAFSPNYDAHLILEQINQMCFCIPEMRRLSLHFVFPKKQPPLIIDNIALPNISCKINDSTKFRTYRVENELIYPINVCRNVARKASQTKYIMVTDIQFIPSEKLATKFLNMISKRMHKINPSHLVYVVPVFEVDEFSSIPRRKDELIELLKQQRACYFHRYTCLHCQKFPRIEKWFKIYAVSDVRPFALVKREYPYHRWEPIFIGTNEEPLYSEVLSWEGLQDKMIQMLEMCLKQYKLVILDGAFLVHWPGIKKITINIQLDYLWRESYRLENNRQYKKIIRFLLKKYKKNPKCKVNDN